MVWALGPSDTLDWSVPVHVTPEVPVHVIVYASLSVPVFLTMKLAL
ncbi:MAG TPA: hypothetical protein VGQ06_12620 [Gemmatimonadales bacterium]|nr:hypothetical protein [Gemmatimonadales bacterium]